MANEEAKEKAMGGYQCARCRFPVLFSGTKVVSRFCCKIVVVILTPYGLQSL